MFYCKRYLHLTKKWHIVTLLVMISPLFSYAGQEKVISVYELSPFYSFQQRGLSNFTPSDDIIPAPKSTQQWYSRIVVEDQAGVLKNMESQLNEWNEREEYARLWSLESTGLYETPNQERKEYFLRRRALKYLDRRLSGELKRAPRNSHLHSVAQVHKSLRPKAEAVISENVKLKFKARVLQGKATMILVNPYVDYYTSVKASGRVNMYLGKNFKEYKLTSYVEYRVDENFYIASVRKGITDQVSASLSSHQSDGDIAFKDSQADKRFEFNYSLRF